MSNNRKRLIGRVIRNSMDKTVVVEVESTKLHRLYKKVIKTRKKFMAHDESNAVPVGALVKIVESRPISKTKRWAVEEVLQMPVQAEEDQPVEASE
jgi:small subunit ribosomal protein S17